MNKKMAIKTSTKRRSTSFYEKTVYLNRGSIQGQGE